MDLKKKRIIECKRADSLSAVRHKCRCGHTVYIPVRCKFVYCDWCFKRVWRDDETEFKFKLMSKMGKTNNEQV